MLAQLVERVNCRAGGRGFDSRGRTNIQGLKITEKYGNQARPGLKTGKDFRDLV